MTGLPRCRLIFTLLMDDGTYQLSRNFRLQAVGDLTWLRTHYDFDAIAWSIDELIVLNVARGDRDLETFARQLTELAGTYFMPLAAGGGVRSMDHARRLLAAGADKIVLNTPVVTDAGLVRELVRTYGSQCVVASIDYRGSGSSTEVFIEDGSTSAGMGVAQAIAAAESLGAGEIYLTSIERDGTGMGFDLPTIAAAASTSRVPVIAAGGVGRFDHLASGVRDGGVRAVATANLFNFMADGLIEARRTMREDHGIDLATWDIPATT